MAVELTVLFLLSFSSHWKGLCIHHESVGVLKGKAEQATIPVFKTVVGSEPLNYLRSPWFYRYYCSEAKEMGIQCRD